MRVAEVSKANSYIRAGDEYGTEDDVDGAWWCCLKVSSFLCRFTQHAYETAQAISAGHGGDVSACDEEK